MAKKRNPQQEQPAAEEQEVEISEEENPAQEEQPQEEPVQEQEPEEQEPEEGQPAVEEEEEQPQEEPVQNPTADENADLRQQLLQARGQIAAYSVGVAPGMVEDAVTLAMAEAAKSGEVTEAALTKAMEAVLKRHPEWQASGTDKPKGGFKVGADRDSGGSYKKQNSDATKNVKRWNRFK